MLRKQTNSTAPQSTRAKRKSDANQTAAALVRAVTGSEPVKGEDLIEDPKLKAEFLAAKAREAARKRAQS